jgi:DNA-binding SARP family transcriptional activator/tetratricopeptide (TPR) repeat protein
MVRLKLSLLGPMVASLGEEQALVFPYAKVKALLVYLSVAAAENPTVAHSREMLMELLWPALRPKAAQDNLRQTLYQLRKLLPAPAGEGAEPRPLLSGRSTVQLNPDYEIELDVAAFTGHLKAGRLAEAVALYRGDFLVDFYLPDSGEFEEWAAAHRAGYRSDALAALNSLTERSLELGEVASARSYAQQQLDIEPALERASRQLMSALARAGDRAAALAEYERCRRELEGTLGVAPSRETDALYRQILADEIRVEPPRTVEVTLPPLPEEEPEPALFVGRERSLEQLAAALSAAQAGDGQLRFVIGEAGSGKTSLVTAFARQAQEADAGLLVGSGQAHVATGVGDPYLLFRALLAQLTGDVTLWSGAGTAEQRRRLWAAMPLTLPALVEQAPDLINTLVPGKELRFRAATFAGPDVAWFRELSARLELDYQDQLPPARLFGQVVALLHAITAEHPLLLILEDLHWADAASIGLFSHLASALRGSRLFLLGTYRPEGLAPTGDGEQHPLAAILGELKRSYGDIWINLDEMQAGELRAFVDELLDSEPNCLDEVFRQALFAHTGGHALFTIELLRAMQERGELARDESGRWAVAGDLNWTALPPRVDGVVEQRLGRLDEALQSALAVASVEGELFTAEVVARVEEEPVVRLVRRLSREVEQQHRLVQAEAVSWVGRQPLSRFRFRHQLFQQHLYQSLSAMERVYLHEQVGGALEALYGEATAPVASRLAWHFEQAGRTGAAAGYLIAAAQYALQVGATGDAENHCRRGIALLEAAPERPETKRQQLVLWATLGSALIAVKGFSAPEVEEAFARAWQLRREAGETAEFLRILYGTWTYYLTRAELAMARALADDFLYEFMHRAGWDEDPLFALVAHKAAGATYFHLGEFERAASYLWEAVSRYDPAMQSGLIARCGYDVGPTAMMYYAGARWWQGYVDEANAYWQRAIAIARQSAHPFTRAIVPAFTILQHRSWGEPELVLEKVGEQLALADKHSFFISQGLGLLEEAVARGASGPVDEAISSFQQAWAEGMAMGATAILNTANLGELAQLCRRAGRLEEALAHLDEALVNVSLSGERYYEPELYRLRGELLWRQGAPLPEVAAGFEQAIESAQRSGARLAELRATVSLCRLLQGQRGLAEARRRLAALLDWFANAPDMEELRQARALLQALTPS